MVIDVAVVLVFTAPVVFRPEVCAAAVLQADLFALPAFVQSYWRPIVAVLVELVFVRVTGAALTAFAAGAFVALLQAALLTLPAFEQS